MRCHITTTFHLCFRTSTRIDWNRMKLISLWYMLMKFIHWAKT